jgi:hypothetical protein
MRRKIILTSLFLTFVAIFIMLFKSKNADNESNFDSHHLDEIKEYSNQNDHNSQTLLSNSKNSYRENTELKETNLSPEEHQKKTPSPKTWFHAFGTIINEKLLIEDISPEINECIMSEFKANLSRQKPYSFDELADSCSIKNDLSEPKKAALRIILKDAISQSRKDVTMEDWYRCASLKKINGTSCINEHYTSLVEQFYKENLGSLTMKGIDFINDWDSAVVDINDKIIANCPASDAKLINEVFNYECTFP